MGRFKCLSLLKSYLLYTSQLSGASILHFVFVCSVCFFILKFSSLIIVGSGRWLPPASIVLPFGGPLGSEIHMWRARIKDGCDILVYRYRRRHFISHQPAFFLELCINTIFLPEDPASPKKPCRLWPPPSTQTLPLVLVCWGCHNKAP